MYLRSQMLSLAGAIILASGAMAQPPVDGGPPQGGQPGPQQQPTNPGAATPPTIPGDRPQETVNPFAADQKFLKSADEGARTQVELGKLAQEKGSSDAVKEFGKRVVDDHGKTGSDLQQLAAKVGVQLEPEMPKKAKKAQEKLSKLSGADFDRAYAKMMLDEHKSDVKAFEKESKNGKIPEAKEFAANSLPGVQERLKIAEELNDSMKGGGKTPKGDQ